MFTRKLFLISLATLLTAWSVQASAADGPSSLKALNGSWVPDMALALDTSCPGGEFLMEKFIVENGDVTGKIGHSQDGPFNFSARIHKDGYVTYYSQAQYVMIKGEGQFTDVEGNGQFIVTGETNCSGSWHLVKEK
jgi:hypothetical protein